MPRCSVAIVSLLGNLALLPPLALLLLAPNASARSPHFPPTANIGEPLDAYHLLYWLPTSHLADYTEWWYFNLYDSSHNVQAIFSYFVNNPQNASGGFFPIGVSEMAAVAYTPSGTVTDADVFLTPSFSAQYAKADVTIGPQNQITVIDSDNYRIAGATNDGRIAWNLLYKREAPSWYAGHQFSVASDPWQLMSWLIYMPRASVSGTLTVDGVTYDIDAPGYHDHNWGEWDFNGVSWNWAQYSQPDLTFDLGDFPQKPGGVASLVVNGRRYIFSSSQYTLKHTQFAFDSANNLQYPVQSVFHASNGAVELDVTMDVIKTDPLAPPMPPPKAVIYEQTVTYTGHATINGTALDFSGNGFKEYTGIAK